MTKPENFQIIVDPTVPKDTAIITDGVSRVTIMNIGETKPERFRRDREWPCPIEGCGASLHSSEQMQLHYQNCHTPEEKEAAWAKVHAFWESKRQVFGLVRVGER